MHPCLLNELARARHIELIRRATRHRLAGAPNRPCRPRATNDR